MSRHETVTAPEIASTEALTRDAQSTDIPILLVPEDPLCSWSWQFKNGDGLQCFTCDTKRGAWAELCAETWSLLSDWFAINVTDRITILSAFELLPAKVRLITATGELQVVDIDWAGEMAVPCSRGGHPTIILWHMYMVWPAVPDSARQTICL